MTAESPLSETQIEQVASLTKEWATTDRVLRSLASGPGTRPPGQVEAAVLVGMRACSAAGISKAQLARRIDIARNSVDRAITAATAAGWVEPAPIPAHDRRQRPVRLTDDGERVVDDVIRTIAAEHGLSDTAEVTRPMHNGRVTTPSRNGPRAATSERRQTNGLPSGDVTTDEQHLTITPRPPSA